jgi:hypothetical protein
MCEEMLKFRNILDEHNIEWEDLSDNSPLILPYFKTTTNIDRTEFVYKGHLISVINGFGTYGGYDTFTMKNHGLLEMWVQDIMDNPIGYLTSSDWWEEIKKILKKAESAYDRK